MNPAEKSAENPEGDARDEAEKVAAEEVEAEPATAESTEGAPEEGEPSPYKNLFVPLVLVPAAIVATILFVFVMFSVVTGKEATLEQNLQRVMSGGQNERDQAVFNLVRQLEENRRARAEGVELPWKVEQSFLDSLQRAWESLPPEDVELRCVMATALSQLDPDEGPQKLLELARLDERLDPEGQYRFQILLNLGATEDPAARPGLVEALADPDPGLRAVAAVALQRIPGDETVAALAEVLDDEDFDVRANAALSLSRFADERAAPTLRELISAEVYEAEHDRNEARFAKAKAVSASRSRAVQALARLGLEEDRARLETLAAGEEDLLVKEALLRALEEW